MNPLITSALISTGQQVLDHCLTAVEKNPQDSESFNKVLNQRLQENFDVARYMNDQGLNSPADVAQHLRELKAQLTENHDLRHTGIPHKNPANTIVLLEDGSYMVKNGELEVTVPQDSQAHEMAKVIHHLQDWLGKA